MTYFPIITYWPMYLIFTLFVFAMLALDLGVFNRKIHEISIKEATIWTTIWISLALIFNVGFYYYTLNKFNSIENFELLNQISPELLAKKLSLEFLTGFIIEKALAIDNIFIFALVFSYFQIPKLYQHRILFWGIIGALIFRGLFIVLGSILLKYKMVVVAFGIVLIFTGLKIFFNKNEEENLDNNFLIKKLKSIFNIYPKIEDKSFLKKIDGKIFVTPLFLALIFIELTDIVFALDSVPAIFSVTKEPFIVFTSNIFAILGLRSMYFMLIGILDKFEFIKYGLAAILVFVGFKMAVLNEFFHGEFPTILSLGIILSILFIAIIASLISQKLKENSNGKELV